MQLLEITCHEHSLVKLQNNAPNSYTQQNRYTYHSKEFPTGGHHR